MESDDLIKKWLNNELGQDEKELFNQLEDAKFNEQIIEGAQQFKASNFSKVEDFETFKNHYGAKGKASKDVFKIHILLKIACVVIVSLGLYFSFFYESVTHIQTLASEKTIITLPDQSVVELNAFSKIDYKKKKWIENRRLTLDGEAYFKVAKGKTFEFP